MSKLYFKRLHKDAILPQKATPHSAGYDLTACNDEPTYLLPMARALIPTGWSMALPEGFEAQIRPRSGLALKNGILVANTPGTIDADYRGHVQVILLNLGQEPFLIEKGMRIAQMVIQKVETLPLELTESLPDTQRGAGGFGSSGV